MSAIGVGVRPEGPTVRRVDGKSGAGIVRPWDRRLEPDASVPPVDRRLAGRLSEEELFFAYRRSGRMP
jgi:hypothetical protein